MSDEGLAAERTALSRRRTTIPFLVVALLGARAALEAVVPGLLVALLAGAGALAATRRSPSELTVVVSMLAAVALLVPPGRGW
jgi:uncharacterized membrane protein YidH (DUF202 family)